MFKILSDKLEKLLFLKNKTEKELKIKETDELKRRLDLIESMIKIEELK